MPPLYRFLAGAVCALFCVSIIPSAAHARSDLPDLVIQRVNALRASYGLPAYRVDPILMQVAQAQAEWSAANNHIGHDGPGGSRPNDRAQAAGYGGGKRSYATENAANSSGAMDVDWVMTGWGNSPVHLAAMISAEYEDMGVGYAEAHGHSWCVLMVGWVNESITAPTRQPTAVVGVRSTAQPDGSISHVVQPGETAWSIAVLYDLSVDDLLALNRLTENSLLYPGDTLNIRLASAQTAAPTALTPQQVAVVAPEVPAAIQSPPPEQRETVSSPASTAPPTVLLLSWGLLAIGILMVGAGIGFGLARSQTAQK